MAKIGMPKLDIIFKGLGASAITRSEKGYVTLIVKEEKVGPTLQTINSIDEVSDLVEISDENLVYIKDVLASTPKELMIARLFTGDKEQYLSENGEDELIIALETDLLSLLNRVNGFAKRNSWIGIANGASEDEADLISFIKSKNKLDHKRFKVLVFQAVDTDDMRVVNFTNEYVTFTDEKRGFQSGREFIPYLLGMLSSISLDMSAIAPVIQVLKEVEEPEDRDEAIGNGELILVNDEGDVRIGRAVNSLVTTGQNVTNDMKFILIVESMDLFYNDIYNVWKDSYRGKYKNSADNQYLFLSAVAAYITALERDDILDGNFDNKTVVDIEKQRLANIPIYGKDEVDSWSDDIVANMTVGTNLYSKTNLKFLNAMEDMEMDVFM